MFTISCNPGEAVVSEVFITSRDEYLQIKYNFKDGGSSVMPKYHVLNYLKSLKTGEISEEATFHLNGEVLTTDEALGLFRI